MTTRGDFFDSLRAVQQQSRRMVLPEDASVQAIRTVDEPLALADATTEIEERAVGTQTYLVPTANSVLNGGFDTDLTSWTESIDGNHTATTARVSADASSGESKTEYGSLASLEVDVPASTGTGQSGRYQDIVAAAAEVWSFEAWVKGSAYANAQARLRIQWLDGADAEISSANDSNTDTAGDWTQRLTLDNQTAPALTAKVRVWLEIDITTIGGTGKAWFDLARAEKASAVSGRARRIIAGEFVVRT